jgi:hypothetical protein
MSTSPRTPRTILGALALALVSASTALAQGGDPTPTPAASGGSGSSDGEARPTASSAIARRWDLRLRGKRVTELSRVDGGQYGGGTSRTDMYLCGDGRLFIDSQSSLAVYVDGANGSSGGRASRTGRWRVVSEGEIPAIEVRLDGGEEGYLAIGWDTRGATYLNGSKVFVTNQAAARCR